MKKNKRIGLMFLLLSAMVSLMAFQIFAQGKIDKTRENSLTLTYKYGDTCLAGAEFLMYKVAEVDEYGVYTTSNAIRDFAIALDFSRHYTDEEWGNWAITLMNLISADETIKPDASSKTDSSGVAVLTAPSAGIYLVVGNPHQQGDWIYKTKAALFALPCMNQEDNTWIYETKAEPKADGVPEEVPESLKVKKIWNDAGYSYRRPNEITVELRKDGDLYDTVVLNKENGWSYVWKKNLDAAANWTIVEKKVPSGYTVSMKSDGITITVTNTTGGGGGGGGGNTPEDPTSSHHETIVDQDIPEDVLETIEEELVPLTILPQTGTTWWFVFLLACTSFFSFFMYYIKNRGCGPDEK